MFGIRRRPRRCRWPEGCTAEVTKPWTGQLCLKHFNEARPRWVAGKKARPARRDEAA